MTQVGRILLRSSQTEDTSPDDGILVGRALAMDHGKVIVARDTARGSRMMSEAVISGLLFQGADVIDAGVLSAPALGMCASRADCAVYVAGRIGRMSGYYLINPDGGLFRDEQVRHLDLVFQNPPKPPAHDRMGTLSYRDGITEEYDSRVASEFPGGVKCSVVVDCMCGAASDSLPGILNGMGADVMAINAQKDPDFRPDTGADGEDGLGSLEDIVEANPGSIGIRVNGIGTALRVVDEIGLPIPPERVFALLVMYLKPKSIAITADSPSIIEEVFRGRAAAEVITPHEDPPSDSGELILTRDSPSAVCDAVAEGAELGYFRGSILFGGNAAIGDGIRAAAAIVQMAGDNSLHTICEGLPAFMRERREYGCPLKADAFRRAVEESLGPLADRCTQYGDEFRIVMDEGWFLLRRKTVRDGDVIEAIAESGDRAYLVGLMEVVGELVDTILRGRQ
ncbi:MAG: hypothetical protein Q4Q62_00265 [Thermoplasmata archaeon]|nr:hypothetical protein [Thermoplasmata archaeon]